ncbi:protein TonB-like [Dermacentor albipictus]|uniref:protein TonB-like n=1 Tax=Dermacentor albipictus TaxID=60249 RepID=UPI0031FD1DBD
MPTEVPGMQRSPPNRNQGRPAAPQGHQGAPGRPTTASAAATTPRQEPPPQAPTQIAELRRRSSQPEPLEEPSQEPVEDAVEEPGERPSQGQLLPTTAASAHEGAAATQGTTTTG